MPIKSSQLTWRYTTQVGPNVASTASTSHGGHLSSTGIPPGQLYNVFGRVSGTTNKNGFTEYRCIALVNNHPLLDLNNGKLWISRLDTRGVSIHIGLDPAGKQATTAFLATRTASLTAAPSGVVFTDPRSEEDGLSIGQLPADWAVAIWLRRRGQNVGSVNPEINVISVGGTTAM